MSQPVYCGCGSARVPNAAGVNCAQCGHRIDRREAFREAEARAAEDFATWPEWKKRATQVPR